MLPETWGVHYSKVTYLYLYLRLYLYLQLYLWRISKELVVRRNGLLNRLHTAGTNTHAREREWQRRHRRDTDSDGERRERLWFLVEALLIRTFHALLDYCVDIYLNDASNNFDQKYIAAPVHLSFGAFFFSIFHVLPGTLDLVLNYQRICLDVIASCGWLFVVLKAR